MARAKSGEARFVALTAGRVSLPQTSGMNLLIFTQLVVHECDVAKQEPIFRRLVDSLFTEGFLDHGYACKRHIDINNKR